MNSHHFKKIVLLLKRQTRTHVISSNSIYLGWRHFSAPLRLFVTSSLTKLHGVDQEGDHRASSTTKRRRGNGDRSLLDFSDKAEADSWSFAVIPNFVSMEEEQALMVDVRRSIRGKKYQFDHWDGAIEGYRETEKSHWSDMSQPIIDRLKKTAATAVEGKSLMPLDEVHALDLAKDGHIKPHIDSVKFCGEVIAGISLLSPCVMTLQHANDEEKWITALLPRLSLYIMEGVVRYEYNHGIPEGSNSEFKGQPIHKDRRVSVICRTIPNNGADTLHYPLLE